MSIWSHRSGWADSAVSLSSQQLVAVVLIVGLTAVNMLGLKFGKWIQNTFTFTKTAALFGLIVVGLWLGTTAKARPGLRRGGIPSANGWDAEDGTSRVCRHWRVRPLCCSCSGRR